MGMKLTRREFLTLSGKTAAGAVLLAACGLPERELILQSPLDAPEDLLHGDDSWYATTWPECTNGEGVIARVLQGRVKKLAGNVDHPLNRGRHSAHYDAGIQTLYHPDRIRQPLYRASVSSPFSTIGWDRALNILREAVAGQTTTVVTNPLSGSLSAAMMGVVAALPNVRHLEFDAFEQGALQNAIERVYRTDVLPHIDVANAATVLSFGADWLSNWLSPVHFAGQYARFREGEERGYLIHAESRFSVTAASADSWLPVRPGYEGVLALALARTIIDEGLASAAEISAFNRLLPNSVINSYSLADVAELTRVSADKIQAAARRFAEHRPSVAFGGGSAGAHRAGSFNLAAIFALNALVGDTNVLSNAPPPGDLQANRNGFDYRSWQNVELAQWRAGFNDTVITRGVDLVHDMPRAARIEDALAAVDNVVVFAQFMNDTARRANLILPETCFLEEWGVAAPNPAPGYPVASFQQPVSGSDPNESDGPRPFGDVMLALTPNGLNGDRSMQNVTRTLATRIRAANPSGGSVQAPSGNLFFQGVMQRGGWWDVSAAGTPLSLASANLSGLERNVSLAEAPAGDGEVFDLAPFQTVSRLDKLAPSAWAQQTPDPLSSAAWTTWAEINSQRAAAMGVREGDLIYIRSEHGEIRATAYPNPATPAGVIGVPVGYGYDDNGRYAEGVGSNALKALVDVYDEETGALAWAATRVRVVKAGGREKLPKVEGDQTTRSAEPGVPVLVVAPGENAEDAEHRYEEEYRRGFDAGAPAPQTEEEHGTE